MDFNVEQKKAIEHHKGPMLVLAGPGSGKTTVIIYRVKYLIEQYNVPPQKILVVTYTKAAATEMKQRFMQLSVLGGESVIFGTFHNVFFRILRKAYGYRLEQIITEAEKNESVMIINNDEKWNFFKKLIMELGIETNDQEEYIKDLLSEISLMKNELIPLKQYHSTNFSEKLFQKMVKKYEQYKAVKNKIDFDDMLTQCYEYLTTEEQGKKYWQNHYEYILLDEYQDINQAQNMCISLLAEPQNNIFAVGDDDQSIYCFRGARPDFLLQFTQKYTNAEKITLCVNYRSTDAHNEAEKIALKLSQIRKKGIPYQQMAVIYRTNLQGGVFARALAQKGIPFLLKDKSFNLYSHWISKDFSAYLKLSQNIENDGELRRIVNKPKRYISRELLESAENENMPLFRTLFTLPNIRKYQQQNLSDLQLHLAQIKKRNPLQAIKYIRNIVGYDDYLREYAKFSKASLEGYLEIAEEITQFAEDTKDIESFLQKLQYMEMQMEQENRKNTEQQIQGVTLSTMHSAKGLEFEVVFIPSIVEEIIPHKKSTTPEQIEEERRLFYVAITRAKSKLYISEIAQRHDKKTKRSCFLKEIGL